MRKVYACLLGEWVCLDDDPNCTIGNKGQNPLRWWDDNAEIYYPFKRQEENTYNEQPYVRIFYNGEVYRIHPMFLQIVGV